MPELPSPVILIISGPAGSGKTTLCERLLAEFPDQIQRLVTTTSRAPRPDEKEGLDYRFLPAADFRKRIEEGAFIEWAKVHGRYYGSQKAHLFKLLENGKDLLLNIDVQGARTFSGDPSLRILLKERLHTVFILPRSLEQLRERLQGRGSDTHEEIERRLASAAREIEAAGEFDHRIISGEHEKDYTSLLQLYRSIRK